MHYKLKKNPGSFIIKSTNIHKDLFYSFDVSTWG